MCSTDLRRSPHKLANLKQYAKLLVLKPKIPASIHPPPTALFLLSGALLAGNVEWRAWSKNSSKKVAKKVGSDFKIPSTACSFLSSGAVLVGNVEGRAWSNDY